MKADDRTSGYSEASGWRLDGTALRVLGTEAAALAAMALALPLRPLLRVDRSESTGIHPTPVVLVHGLFGDPTNFITLRSFLRARGIRRFASFSYLPRLDYQRLATRLAERIEAVRRETGANRVDVVAHSLGGLVARYLVAHTTNAPVRRLVTLGSPYWTTPNPPHELAIFAEQDALVPPAPAQHGRSVVIDSCGHFGLLRNPRALTTVARFLTRPAIARPTLAAA